MNSYSIQFDTEAEFVEFKKLFFEKELAKIAKKEEKLKNQLKELRAIKNEIMEEFSQFKKEYPSYFRRGRKRKDA